MAITLRSVHASLLENVKQYQCLGCSMSCLSRVGTLVHVDNGRCNDFNNYSNGVVSYCKQIETHTKNNTAQATT